MKRLTKLDFKTMPWKNGGGITTELFRYPNEGEFLFRLSRAEVTQDGAFSSFPGIDRYLYLLNGQGCTLSFPDQEVPLLTDSSPLFFPGEVPVFCKLRQGAIQDFNVMINRRWGEASVKVIKGHQGPLELQSVQDGLWAYDVERD